MSLENKIRAFALLGDLLKHISDNQSNNTELNSDILTRFSEELSLIFQQCEQQNAWFTEKNIRLALKNWSKVLSLDTLQQWVKPYNFHYKKSVTVALILAGNIPLVGFHDLICTLITGHSALIKLSSNDKILLPFLVKYLQEIYPPFQNKIHFTNDKLSDYQAVIATGSNNTSRYFEYYFSHKPHIIRKNRNSIAILTGQETQTELKLLGEDIFNFFGLGCRSISKLFIPRNYDFKLFFNSIFNFSDVINHTKYANNYDYNKAVYLMSLYPVQDNGFLILKEDEKIASPVASIFYEYYDNISELRQKLNEKPENIQCIVSNFESDIAFGQTQCPNLWDYADNVDTIDFLLNL